MTLPEALNYYHYRSSIDELRWLNGGDYNGITYNSMLYLNVIANTPDCTPSKLADMVRITRPAVTIKVNELVKRGFVVKEPSAEDKRIVYLRLNEQMREQYRAYYQHGVLAEKLMLAKYSERETELLARMLMDIANMEPEEWKHEHER